MSALTVNTCRSLSMIMLYLRKGKGNQNQKYFHIFLQWLRASAKYQCFPRWKSCVLWLLCNIYGIWNHVEGKSPHTLVGIILIGLDSSHVCEEIVLIRLIEVKKTHSTGGQHHSLSLDLGLNKKKKTVWIPTAVMLTDCRCNAISCFKLLTLGSSQHGTLYPPIVTQN